MRATPPPHESSSEQLPGRPRAEERRRFLVAGAVTLLLNVGWLAIGPADQRDYLLLLGRAVVGLLMLVSVDTDSAGLGVIAGGALAGVLYLAALAFF